MRPRPNDRGNEKETITLTQIYRRFNEAAAERPRK